MNIESDLKTILIAMAASDSLTLLVSLYFLGRFFSELVRLINQRLSIKDTNETARYEADKKLEATIDSNQTKRDIAAMQLKQTRINANAAVQIKKIETKSDSS